MIRIAHTALLALLVAVALITHGAKQESRQKRAELDGLAERQAAVRAEIETLRLELAHLSSPDRLRELLRQIHGAPGLRDPSGAALAPWRPDQLVDLSAPRVRTGPLRSPPSEAGRRPQ